MFTHGRDFTVFSRGAKGGNFPVGRTHARNPTANLAVTRGLLRRGGLGPTAGAVLVRTTCVGGVLILYTQPVIAASFF